MGVAYPDCVGRRAHEVNRWNGARRALRRCAALLAAGAGLLAATPSASPPAGAGTIPDVITSVSVRQKAVGPYEWMRIDLRFEVPRSARSGDTFTLALPPQLDSLTTGLRIAAADGSTIATAVVVNDVWTFALAPYVDANAGVAGSAYFEARLDRSTVAPDSTVELVFVAGGTSYSDAVRVESSGLPSRSAVHKYQLWEDASQAALVWGVDSPVTPAGSSTVVLTDTPGPGSVLDCASVVVTSSGRLDAFHEPVAPTEVDRARVSVVCSGTQARAVVTSVGEGSLVRLSGRSTISDPARGRFTNVGEAAVNGAATAIEATTRRVDGAGTGTSTTRRVPASGDAAAPARSDRSGSRGATGRGGSAGNGAGAGADGSSGAPSSESGADGASGAAGSGEAGGASNPNAPVGSGGGNGGRSGDGSPSDGTWIPIVAIGAGALTTVAGLLLARRRDADPEQPDDPEQPGDPEQPDDPEQPADPAEGAEGG